MEFKTFQIPVSCILVSLRVLFVYLFTTYIKLGGGTLRLRQTVPFNGFNVLLLTWHEVLNTDGSVKKNSFFKMLIVPRCWGSKRPCQLCFSFITKLFLLTVFPSPVAVQGLSVICKLETTWKRNGEHFDLKGVQPMAWTRELRRESPMSWPLSEE